MSYQARRRHGGDKHMLLSERSPSEKATSCIITTKWHSGRGKTMETVKRSVVARGWSGEGWKGRVQRTFRAAKLLCMILQWQMHVFMYLSKPIECTTPRVHHNVNYELQEIMMCQCRFISCNECTTTVGDADHGRGCAWGGRGGGTLCTSRSIFLWT